MCWVCWHKRWYDIDIGFVTDTIYFTSHITSYMILVECVWCVGVGASPSGIYIRLLAWTTHTHTWEWERKLLRKTSLICFINCRCRSTIRQCAWRGRQYPVVCMTILISDFHAKKHNQFFHESTLLASNESMNSIADAETLRCVDDVAYASTTKVQDKQEPEAFGHVWVRERPFC